MADRVITRRITPGLTGKYGLCASRASVCGVLAGSLRLAGIYRSRNVFDVSKYSSGNVRKF